MQPFCVVRNDQTQYKEEKCSFCKHLTPAHLKCLRKYKSMRFLSSACNLQPTCASDVLYHLCMNSQHARLFVTNMIYLRLISVIVNNYSVNFVLRYLLSLGIETVTYRPTMLRRPTPGLYFLFDCGPNSLAFVIVL